jgi:3-hydroxyacyl-CoA dehydrogenase/enoyl-CoA hydratase/3-hydroxybutyryl-CoA epimerase
VTPGTLPLLPALAAARSAAAAAGLDEAQTLLAVALAAAHAQSAGAEVDPELADVAAVIAGLHPSYTGGPFNYLRQLTAGELRQRVAAGAARHPALFAMPAQSDGVSSQQ